MSRYRWLTLVVLVAFFAMGVLYTRPERLTPVSRPCELEKHDGDPWIVPGDRLDGYCNAEGYVLPGKRTGAFKRIRTDNFLPLDIGFWDKLSTTFFCNQATFTPSQVKERPTGGIALEIEAVPGVIPPRHDVAPAVPANEGDDPGVWVPPDLGERAYVSGNIATKDIDYARYQYGRFEIVLKPPKVSGVLTAFFLHRYDPWQEIDTEFLGRDTTKMLVNVFYNPGEPGDLYNYGYRGTPVLIDLGFDAADDFHKYAVEWEQNELRWFVDDELVHVRSRNRPTPIPHLPMRLHVNTWPCCSEELAGPFDATALPISAEIKSLNIDAWYPPPLTRLGRVIEGGEWRNKATWIQ
ncbi:MAG: family 16 glycosylhydrolase [Proteobacteria bacterium]|jgi:hypothetical protein|nr:family 16 glycosylhydrolase [Pseudomonadota bacterium]